MEGQHPVLADRYRLAEPIGRGGMADVYSAEDTHSGRLVAVKVMRVGEAADPDRFSAEMRILERLSHPAIVRLFDTGRTSEDSPYFVMQLIEGESLSARLREEGPLPEADLVKVARRVAGALAHAHERGVVHRDIKPANILIDEAGRGFLTDFGVARLVDATMITRAGTTIGTAAYLAPEQLQDSAVGPEADVYSLGLVLIEAFTGRRAFRGIGVEAAMARLGRDPAIPEDLPDNWRGLLMGMTRRDPLRRPSAAVVEAVLRGRQPPPPLDPEELAARLQPAAPGDEDPTAITPLTGDRRASWDPPSGGSPPPPPPTPPPATAPPPASTIASPGPAAVGSPTPDPAAGPRGLDAIRSRALVVGAILGAILVLLVVAVGLTLGSDDDPVRGTDPVDDAVRTLLDVLAASETLQAADPSLTRDLRVLSDDIVEAVNEDRWNDALEGVAASGQVARAGIERFDIDEVALTGLLDALRALTTQIEAEIEADAGPQADGEEGAVREVRDTGSALLASRSPTP